jgi:hypothetical protein
METVPKQRPEQSRIHDTQHGGAMRSGTQRSARIRRHAGRFDAAETVQTPGAAFSSGASGFLQHLPPPQLRPSHKLPQLSFIRVIDSDAGSIAGKRRPEWRLNPLYQIGGPRSAQLALKLLF